MHDELNTSTNFIKRIVENDIEKHKNQGRIATRFPPEPNGYLHIGHAKAITLDFGIADEYKGTCNLRLDDTNPVKEDKEYIDAIKKDIKWLGYDWGNREFHTSDYFEKLFDFAIQLIKKGKAFVCDLPPEKIREYRGTLTEPGKESPYRNRSIDENLDLFMRMKAGEFKDSEKSLRAKIDMTSPNLNMRDPVIYRIRHIKHHRTGEKWCIYPMYDFAHSLSDAIENITHSLCTLEFEDHRPLYNWFVENVDISSQPRQIEFARLNLTYTVMSKRKLLNLVEKKIVDDWDDPRLPTLSGIRRRGYTPESIKVFCDKIGIAKSNSIVDIELLESCIRDDLNVRARRVMVVLNPLKVIIDNYPEEKEEWLDAENNPEDPKMGKRQIPFGRELYIEKEDFMEEPPKKFFRLSPGKEVRLKHAYYITCTSVEKDEQGNITAIHCTYDPATKGGWSNDGRRVKGTLHWVSVKQAKSATVKMYDRLFTVPNPENAEKNKTFLDYINPESYSEKTAKIEPSLIDAEPGTHFQFLRLGYFTVDTKNFKKGNPVFNRTVLLRDSWAKISKKLKS